MNQVNKAKKDEMKEKLGFLSDYGIPDESLSIPVIGGYFLQNGGGPALADYWHSEKTTSHRDEFYMISNTYIALAGLLHNLNQKNDWAQMFHVAYLMHYKANVQSLLSVDRLCQIHCYSDATIIVRAIHTRVNLLLLFALNPCLFDEWLTNPKDLKYRDGKVREILRNSGVNTMSHVYEQYSEIIHGQYQAMWENGYMSEGLFREMEPIGNRIYIIMKYIIGIAGFSLVAMIIEDLGLSDVPDKVKNFLALYKFLDDKLLRLDRLENLTAVLAEERHWEKAGKDSFNAGEAYDFQQLQRQIHLHHRRNQPKKLRKPYNDV